MQAKEREKPYIGITNTVIRKIMKIKKKKIFFNDILQVTYAFQSCPGAFRDGRNLDENTNMKFPSIDRNKFRPTAKAKKQNQERITCIYPEIAIWKIIKMKHESSRLGSPFPEHSWRSEKIFTHRKHREYNKVKKIDT